MSENKELLLKRIELINFRKFRKRSFEFRSGVTIINGDNGLGKSSLLEAIHIATNTLSPWTSSNDAIINFQSDSESYKINADIEIGEEEFSVTVINRRGESRYELNGKKVSSAKISERLVSNIFSAEQLDVLMLSPSKRRVFLDSLLGRIDKEYKYNLDLFNKTLRQRNARLKKLAKDFYERNIISDNDKELMIWTDKFIDLSTKLTFTRNEYIERINNLTESAKIDYSPDLRMNLFEEMAIAEDLKKIHKKQTLSMLKKDIATGYTNLGAHRDDWRLFAKINGDEDVKDLKNMHRYGSRGEKRYGIYKILIGIQKLYNEILGHYPLLMLDDITSELDDKKIASLFDDNDLYNQQLIITTIRTDYLPKNILKNSAIVNLK
ncbi:MAG TPA: DNA replication/repair protein RecF [bacterium]|nr:DNA replication/repair protein RecF [bacterium]